MVGALNSGSPSLRSFKPLRGDENAVSENGDVFFGPNHGPCDTEYYGLYFQDAELQHLYGFRFHARGFLTIIKYMGVNKSSLPPATSASAPKDSSVAVSAVPEGARRKASMERRRQPMPIRPRLLMRRYPRKSMKLDEFRRSPASGAYHGFLSAR